MSILSAAILLFVVMDPFGNMPFFVSVLETVTPKRRLRVLVRELLIALVLLVGCLFAGPSVLSVLHISAPSLGIAGGIILFLIALKMVFGGTDQLFKDVPGGEPLVVPLAVPSVAGPSAMATLLLLVGQEPERWGEWLLALALAWAVTAVLLALSTRIAAVLGKRALCALERLMGLMLTAIAIEMLITGIGTAFGVPIH